MFVRKSYLGSFKDEPPKTVAVEEGNPYGLECDSPDGWPNPSVYWMLQGQNWLKTINSSRLTVDPEGNLWFSNVTRKDASEDFLYACSASSYFRNEYKLGNRVSWDLWIWIILVIHFLNLTEQKVMHVAIAFIHSFIHLTLLLIRILHTIKNFTRALHGA